MQGDEAKTYHKAAIERLRQGELVVIPTETVYGLAADAQNEKAIQKIYDLKNRPNINPLISHYADIEEIKKDVVLDERAIKLLEEFSPGPLTFVLNKKPESRISSLATASLKTAAVRIPDHQISLEILKEFAAPVAAPSANISTELSPTRKEHVEKSFKDHDLMIIDGGDCSQGLESTIVDLSTDKAIILRFGTITSQEIEKVLNEKVFLKDDSGEIKAPGSMLKHYAPKTKLRLGCDNPQENEALLAFGDKVPTGFTETINLSPRADLAEIAQKLFTSIHELDEKSYSSIAVMPIPNEGIGLAINDRLKKAASA